MPVLTDRVAFRRPFVLKGLKGVQSPGTYSVETHEERLGIWSFLIGKGRSTKTTWIRICGNRGIGGILKSVELDPTDLAAALKMDALPPQP